MWLFQPWRMSNFNHKFPIPQVIAAAYGCLTFLSSGCLPIPKASSSAYLYIDVSDQTPDRMLEEVRILFRIQRSLPPGTPMTISTFADESATIYVGQPVADRARFNDCIGELLVAPPLVGELRSTRFDRLFDSIETDVGKSANSVVAIVSDGGFELSGTDAEKTLNKQIATLAKQANLHGLILVGVLPQYRIIWTKRLLRLGKRAGVYGTNDTPYAFYKFSSAARGH